MKKFLLLTVVILWAINMLKAQQYIDVVYLKNGSIIRGVILEQIPNQSIKIKTADKSLFVYKMDEVDKIVKEESEPTSTSTYSDKSDEASPSVSFSMKVGPLFNGPGKVSVGGVGEFSTKVSPLIKADIDGILVPKLSMGASVILGSIGSEEFDESASYMSVGMTIKPRFNISDEVQIRPGMLIGYNYMNHDKWQDNSNGLNVGFQLEISRYLPSGFMFVGEFGFISQPVGGTPQNTIQFPPILYMMFGIQFDK
jgi:hypothetical protein